MTKNAKSGGGAAAQAVAKSDTAALASAVKKATNGGISSDQVGVSLKKFMTTIESGDYRFVISDSPTDANVDAYVAEWKRRNVECVIRACDDTYETTQLTASGISVEEMPFADGESPPADVIERWGELAASKFNSKAYKERKLCIAVHCVAGLGRAPVLVAIALIQFGMEPLDAIAFVRARRRGAINARQLKFLESFTPAKQPNKCCVIS